MSGHVHPVWGCSQTSGQGIAFRVGKILEWFPQVSNEYFWIGGVDIDAHGKILLDMEKATQHVVGAYNIFLTDVKSVLRQQLDVATIMQAKLIGLLAWLLLSGFSALRWWLQPFAETRVQEHLGNYTKL